MAATQYEPRDHIQHLAAAPRADSVLDQREITIQSYQTNVPFDYKSLRAGLESAWLTPQIRFGVFAWTPLQGTDALHVVLGLQDELSVRAYDYDARRPLWFTWQDVILDTVSVHYVRDESGLLRFKATGGGRRITDDRLNDFNATFLHVPKDAVVKREFDLAKLRKLCFDRFVDRLYMLRFADPSGQEYRSIDHALFQSRQYIDPQADRLREIQSDPEARIESFDSDTEVRDGCLNAPIQVRFFIRGLSGSLRLRFPRISYKKEPKTPDEQARVFYKLVDAAEGVILDADYYTHAPRSLDELEVDLGLFPDNVDLTQFRDVMLSATARQRFFETLNLGEPWSKWQPHLRALNQLLPTAGITDHVTVLLRELIVRDPREAAALLEACRADAQTRPLGKVVADVLVEKLQTISAADRPRAEAAILSWAVDQEMDSWDVDPKGGEMMVFGLRWKPADLAVDCLTAVLWKLVGVLHERLKSGNGNIGELLRRFNWCMTTVKALPPNPSGMPAALRLVAEGKVPSSVADGAKVLKSGVADCGALDDAVLQQFGLPLWPCLVATRENGTVTIRNEGIGIAPRMRGAPSGTLFSASEGSEEVDLCPGNICQLPVSGAPTTLDMRFVKFGAERHVQVPVTVIERATPPASDGNSIVDAFGWAKQVELWRATERVLGEGEAPAKGTISKAVQARELESNGQSGRACSVKVDSYKAWITKAKGLGNDEVLQIMDAITTEIRGRK